MTQPSKPSFQKPLDENEDAQVFSIRQENDGSWHLSRRDFFIFGLVAGGAAVVHSVCPRFGSTEEGAQLAQAGISAASFAPLYLRPLADTAVLDRLMPNHYVLLLNDRPDLGWVEVVTEAGQRGWIQRSFIDFSGAVTRQPAEVDQTMLAVITATPTPETPQETSAESIYVFLPIIFNSVDTVTPEPSRTPCPAYTNPCPANVPSITPSVCACNAFPCVCNTNPCSCNTMPCVCNAFPCICNTNPCSCNTMPCVCNAFPCVCNTNPCSCNTMPCVCNAFPCVCNANPCSCNAFPCACNAFPCACNAFPCACNIRPCAVT